MPDKNRRTNQGKSRDMRAKGSRHSRLPRTGECLPAYRAADEAADTNAKAGRTSALDVERIEARALKPLFGSLGGLLVFQRPHLHAVIFVLLRIQNDDRVMVFLQAAGNGGGIVLVETRGHLQHKTSTPGDRRCVRRAYDGFRRS